MGAFTWPLPVLCRPMSAELMLGSWSTPSTYLNFTPLMWAHTAGHTASSTMGFSSSGTFDESSSSMAGMRWGRCGMLSVPEGSSSASRPTVKYCLRRSALRASSSWRIL